MCRLPRLHKAFLFHRLAASPAAAFQAAVDLSTAKDMFPRPAELTVRSAMPVEEMNQGSTVSRSTLQMSRSLPNVILPRRVDPLIRSTFESPRMSSCDGSQREKDKLEFEKFPTSSTFNFRQLTFGIEVSSASDHSSDAMSWIREIEAAQDINDLGTSLSITGKYYFNFDMLDAEIANAWG